MGPALSERRQTLDPGLRTLLLNTARASVRHGLAHGRALPVTVEDYPPPLQEPRATFVTLKLDGRLRGCIGTLEAYRPLVQDVAENAFAAAFQDPRFPPLGEAEYPRLEYHVSILSEPEPFPVRDEADLLARLRPGVDGLVLSQGPHRATFLPAVWDSLPDARDFVAHLKLKAGLPAEHWSDAMRFERYTVEEFGG